MFKATDLQHVYMYHRVYPSNGFYHRQQKPYTTFNVWRLKDNAWVFHSKQSVPGWLKTSQGVLKKAGLA